MPVAYIYIRGSYFFMKQKMRIWREFVMNVPGKIQLQYNN